MWVRTGGKGNMIAERKIIWKPTLMWNYIRMRKKMILERSWQVTQGNIKPFEEQEEKVKQQKEREREIGSKSRGEEENITEGYRYQTWTSW